MLTISKPTLFGADGLAVRGQGNHDSPGWQLRWFDRQTSAAMIWQGAFKTCRHLQTNCVGANNLDEAKKMVEELLNAESFTQFASQPTDLYPTAKDERPTSGSRRRKKKKKH